ncbi:MAG: hypothetical protein C4326_13325 [Ignavibacteria bacterium]
MDVESARTQIAEEFAKARDAQRRGNEGMVRVCARRAAGIALRTWFAAHGRKPPLHDAIRLLRDVVSNESLPAAVREAAERLTTRVTEHFTSPFSTHPLDDATIIINYFLEQL